MNKQPQAIRPIFIAAEDCITVENYQFDFYGGFSLEQKRKSINAFHKVIKENMDIPILEVSRKSDNLLGNKLSAFNLVITIKDKQIPVECIYQASKVFGNKQFKECLSMEPGEAKKYVSQNVNNNNLTLTGFNLFGKEFPLYPFSLFYDFLYIWALSQNEELAKEILEYTGFTDIEFNPKKQVASQARSCAIYKHLYMINKVNDFLKSFEDFFYVYDI